MSSMLVFFFISSSSYGILYLIYQYVYVPSVIIWYVDDSFVCIVISVHCSAFCVLYLCFKFVQVFSTSVICFAIFKWEILYSLSPFLQVVLIR